MSKRKRERERERKRRLLGSDRARKPFLQIKLEGWKINRGGVVIAQWTRLHLPSCRPLGSSPKRTIYPFIIYSQICVIVVVWKTTKKSKTGQICLILKKDEKRSSEIQNNLKYSFLNCPKLWLLITFWSKSQKCILVLFFKRAIPGLFLLIFVFSTNSK